MFEIDRAKFGAFVAELRKEKGITQKELAEKLCISDKAISKWETGNSIPDVTLLIPLAEILGVSVTELLECRRMENPESMDKNQTDNLVKKVIELSEEERAEKRKKNLLIYGICVFVSIVQMFCIYMLHRRGGLLGTIELMPIFMTAAFAIGFGAYFWIFIKEKLPSYYDENEISVYVDGILHMNMPGVVYNNNNWPYIVKALRGWSVFGMLFFPMVYILLIIPLRIWGIFAQLPIILGFILGGLFIPVYIVGRKHQYGDNPPAKRKSSLNKIIIWGVIIVVVIFAAMNGFGGGIRMRSGTSNMFFSNEGIDYWNAEYQYFDGDMERTLWMEEEDTLKISVETDEGDLDLEIKDKDGNVIYTEDEVGTKEFEIDVSGKISIRVDADEHEGSFKFE